MDPELFEGGRVKAEEDTEDEIKTKMAIIVDKADAQKAALPNQDVRESNRARDRAKSARERVQAHPPTKLLTSNSTPTTRL